MVGQEGTMVDDASQPIQSKWKQVGSIMTHVASIAGILSLPVGVLAIRDARRIAAASGDLAKSQVVFGLGNYASSNRLRKKAPQWSPSICVRRRGTGLSLVSG